MPLSEARKRANEKWRKNNPKQSRKNSYRSTARTFVRHWADEEELVELEGLIRERREKLKSNA